MIQHSQISAGVHRLIRKGEVSLGGYRRQKIYGRLDCPSGKRMKMKNRVFFSDEEEAVSMGYRPCGTCLPEKYRAWKKEQEGSSDNNYGRS